MRGMDCTKISFVTSVANEIKIKIILKIKYIYLQQCIFTLGGLMLVVSKV